LIMMKIIKILIVSIKKIYCK